MKTINKNEMSEFVEHYFDCPHCQYLISDDGAEFDEIAVCENCGNKIKIE